MAWLFNQIPENNWTNMVINGLGIEPTAVYPFTVTLNSSQGDPAYGCSKTFTSTYKCGSKSSPVKNISIPASADNTVATFNCSDEANKCNNLKLTLADNGQLLLTTLDGKTTLWDSVTAGFNTINPNTVIPVTLTENTPNNKPLTVPDYAGDFKPNPTVDVGAGEGPGRRYTSNVLLPGQFLEEGQWIGSPSGTCRLIMGTPDKPNALQVVTSILGCNSLDAPLTVTNTKLKNLGCWNDSGNRALSKYNGNVTTKEQCAELAQENGSNIFGLQYYGECWSNVPGDNYKKYGKSTKECTDLGTGWQNHVYKIVGSDDIQATRVYTVQDMHNSSKGKVGYIDNLGQLNVYPEAMTRYTDSFENIKPATGGGYKISSGGLLGSPVSAPDVTACEKLCKANGDTQRCAGFVFDSTSAMCQLLNTSLYGQNRIIDANNQYFARSKNVSGQDSSCPTGATPKNTFFWNDLKLSTNSKSNPMTATTKCGLANYVEGETDVVSNALSPINKDLVNANDITTFRYLYDSLHHKYSNLIENIFNTKSLIDTNFADLLNTRKNLADWSGEQLQNLEAMNEDRDLNMMSQNYRHILWSILAIVIIIGTMKIAKSTATGTAS